MNSLHPPQLAVSVFPEHPVRSIDRWRRVKQTCWDAPADLVPGCSSARDGTEPLLRLCSGSSPSLLQGACVLPGCSLERQSVSSSSFLILLHSSEQCFSLRVACSQKNGMHPYVASSVAFLYRLCSGFSRGNLMLLSDRRREAAGSRNGLLADWEFWG